MRKHISRYSQFAIAVLVVTLMLSISVNTFATDNNQPSGDKEIAQSLKAVTVNEEERTVFNIYADKVNKNDLEVSIKVDESFFGECPELSISIHCEDEKEIAKEIVFDDVLYVGKNTASIKGISFETRYFITAQGIHNTSAENYTGYFILHEKKEDISVEYRITHDRYIPSEYNRTEIQKLHFASEVLQGANDKYGCYNKETAVLDKASVTESELENINSAATLLAEYAAAGVGYEVEPNGSMETAYRIYDDDTTYGTIGNSGDIDYYKVLFTLNGNANFWLGDIPAGQDYDLYLYTDDGTLVRSSTSTSNQEQIYNYPVISYTWYYLKVVGYNGSYNSSSYYQLRAKNYPTAQSSDRYETNDTFSSASNISIPNGVSANIHTDTDVDYYKFVAHSPSTVTISLNNVPSGCDYDIYLFDNTLTQRAASTNGGNSSESITYTVTVGTTYYIKVCSFCGYSSSNYALVIDTSPVISYPPDYFEPNDSISSAREISVNMYFPASIHTPTDVDYFKFYVDEPSCVDITLSNIPTGCDYELKLFRGYSSNPIASSCRNGNATENVTLDIDGNNLGWYFVLIEAYGNSCSNLYYYLRVDLSPLYTVPEIPANAIGVHVTNEQGLPIQNAAVYVYRQKYQTPMYPLSPVTTDEMGYAIISNLSSTGSDANGYGINIIADNYAAKTYGVLVHPETISSTNYYEVTLESRNDSLFNEPLIPWTSAINKWNHGYYHNLNSICNGGSSCFSRICHHVYLDAYIPQNFGWRYSSTYSDLEFHQAIDISLTAGTPQYNIFTEGNTKATCYINLAGCGNTVQLYNDSTQLFATYMHLNDFSLSLSTGTYDSINNRYVGVQVAVGQQIGETGGTSGDYAHPFSPHMHFSLSQNERMYVDMSESDYAEQIEKFIDPLKFFN